MIKIKPDIRWNRYTPFEILGFHYAIEDDSDYPNYGDKLKMIYYFWFTILNFDVGIILTRIRR